MSDTFLPGSGFDTYESQDKVLVQMDGSRECAVAVRILQQQGFAVAAEQTADAESAKKAAEALGIECIVLNAEALAGQDADVLGEGGTPLFAALLTAADKLGMQYVATTHRARVETGADGVHTVCPPAGTGSDDSTILAALPQETLARLILPLGDFAPEDVAEMAEDFKV
jgi:tRNA U34 2-thiouridine synthase MnmA/TrmU